jgi:hypothetical protein
LHEDGAVSVEAISTADFGDFQRRLTDIERRVFVKHESRILKAFKRQWVGWLYLGRPPGDERNVSVNRWSSDIETTSTSAVTLRILNTADYSGGVHRSGTPVIEWERIWAEVQATLIPVMIADLKREIERDLTTPKAPKKLGARGGPNTAVRRFTL